MKNYFYITAMMLIGVVNVTIAQNEVNKDSIIIVPNTYDDIEIGSDNLFIVKKGNKFGVINSEGKSIVPLQFDEIEVGTNNNDCRGLIKVSIDTKNKKRGEKEKYIGLYNTNGDLIVPFEKNDYDNIYIQNNYYGYEGLAKVNVFEKLRIDTIYHDYDSNKIDNINAIRLKHDGVLLADGTLISSYDMMNIEYGGLILVKKDSKYGVLNNKGEIVKSLEECDLKIKGKFILISKWENGKRGKGLFDNKGNIIIPIGKFESIDVNSKCLIVEKNKQKGVLSHKGTVVVQTGLYDKLYEENCENENFNYIKAYKGDKKGALTCDGKLFIPCGKYSSFEVIDDKLTIVTTNGQKGIINRNGMTVIPIGKYNDLRYKYGIIYYSQNGKYGIIDNNGKQVTSAIYDVLDPQRHSNGFAVARKDNKVCILNNVGRVIMPLDDYLDSNFSEDVGMLRTNNGTVFFNTKGEILSEYGVFEKTEEKYGKLKALRLSANEGYFIYNRDNKKGIIRLW